MNSDLRLTLPLELADRVSKLFLPTPEARMTEVIEWSRINVECGGGPFAAGVFDYATGACVALGVNRVVDCHCSVAHAEMMALMFAQQELQTHDLRTKGEFVLTSSSQPCCQCFGALLWSGIQHLEFGASREQVETIGFDEGPLPSDWDVALEQRGIQVTGPLLSDQAAQVLLEYNAQGGPLY